MSQISYAGVAQAVATVALLAFAVATTSCTAVQKDIAAVPKPTGYEQQPGGRFVACADCDHPTRKTLASVRATAVSTHITVLPPTTAASQSILNTSAWTPSADRPSAAVSADAELHERATIEFRFDTAELNPAARVKLAQLAPMFRAATRIRMLGFTDDVGPKGPNDKLATERAMAVHLFIRSLVRDASGPVLTSRGDALCCYLTDNRTEAQRSTNRRVEVLITLPAAPKSQALARQLARLLTSTVELAGDAVRLADARPIAEPASGAASAATGTSQ